MTDSRLDWITLKTTDGPMRCFTAHSSGTSGAAVVVLQEAFGVNDHIKEVTRRFAARGYVAIAPELFHRTGGGTVDYADRDRAISLIDHLGPQQIDTDVDAVLLHLDGTEHIDLAHTAIVGFCFGGRAAFTAATANPGLGAAVVFYGPGIAAGPYAVIDRAQAITAPLMLHVGANDPTIPAAAVEAIDDALTDAGVEHEQHVYPNAGHAFACDARPQMYRAEAAELAWQRTFDFLDERLRPLPE